MFTALNFLKGGLQDTRMFWEEKAKQGRHTEK